MTEPEGAGMSMSHPEPLVTDIILAVRRYMVRSMIDLTEPMVTVIQQHTLLLLLDGDGDLVRSGNQLSCLGVFVQKAMRCQVSACDLSATTLLLRVVAVWHLV